MVSELCYISYRLLQWPSVFDVIYLIVNLLMPTNIDFPSHSHLKHTQ